MRSTEVEPGKSYLWRKRAATAQDARVVTIEGKGRCGLSARTAEGRLVFPRSKDLEPLEPSPGNPR